jgi:Domain of unknown function (DUF4129)
VRRSAVAVALLLSVLAVSAVRPATAQTTVDVDGYLARLDQAQTLLGDPNADPAEALGAARAALALPVQVTWPDGSSVIVTDGALLGTADDGDDAAAVSASQARLADASAAASSAKTAPAPDPARIASAISSAYGGEVEAPSLTQRILSRIAQALGWLLDHTLGALVRSTAGSVVAWLLVIAAVAAFLWFGRRSRFGIVPEARTDVAASEVAIVDWRRAADEALARGDQNEAVMALYHVLVHTLASRGVVREAPSLTAGECRWAVRRERPALAAPIERATAAFERVAYGKQDAVPGDVDALRAAEQEAKRA